MLTAAAITLRLTYYRVFFNDTNSSGGSAGGTYDLDSSDRYNYHNLSNIGILTITGPNGINATIKLTGSGWDADRMIGTINGKHINVSIQHLSDQQSTQTKSTDSHLSLFAIKSAAENTSNSTHQHHIL